MTKKGRAALQARRGVAIERVLADVEIEGREFDIGEVAESTDDPLEVEFVVALADDLVEFRQAMQHQLFEFRQIGISNLVAMVMSERAEHPTDGVADLAIAVDVRLDDRLARRWSSQ